MFQNLIELISIVPSVLNFSFLNHEGKLLHYLFTTSGLTLLFKAADFGNVF